MYVCMYVQYVHVDIEQFDSYLCPLSVSNCTMSVPVHDRDPYAKVTENKLIVPSATQSNH